MNTKEQIINNLREYDAGQIAEFIREGKLSLYELSKSGKLTPLMRKRIEERLGSSADNAPAGPQPTPSEAPAAGVQPVEPAQPEQPFQPEQPIQPVQPVQPKQNQAPAEETWPTQAETPAEETRPTPAEEPQPTRPAAPKKLTKKIAKKVVKKSPTESPAVQPADLAGGEMDEPAAAYVPTPEPYEEAGAEAQPWSPQEEPAEACSQAPTLDNRGMWKRPFSFKGRIRRTEYGLTYIIVYIIYTIFLYLGIAADNAVMEVIVLLVYIGIYWLLFAQGAKRCHDLGHSGWFQIIPFYVFVMLFANGERGYNKYGNNPKNQ